LEHIASGESVFFALAQRRKIGFGETPAQELFDYLRAAPCASAHCPTGENRARAVFRRSPAACATRHHSPYGKPLTGPWGLACAKRLRKFNFELQRPRPNDNIVLFPDEPRTAFDLADAQRYLLPPASGRCLIQELLECPMFMNALALGSRACRSLCRASRRQEGGRRACAHWAPKSDRVGLSRFSFACRGKTFANAKIFPSPPRQTRRSPLLE